MESINIQRRKVALKGNPATFVRMADEKYLPALLGRKYETTVRWLYRHRLNLYSFRNSISMTINDQTAGMLWFVDSEWITFLSILTWIGLLVKNPLTAARMIWTPRGRLTTRLDKDSVYVLVVSTMPSFRNRGIGSRLLAELERLAMQRGRSSIELDVDEQNTHAVEFYQQRGYRTVFSHHFYQFGAHSVYQRMRKLLYV